MNRKEIKELAKEKIKGNKWNIIWPMLVISVVSSILVQIFGGTVKMDFTNLDAMETFEISPASSVWSLVVTLAIGIVTAGYISYILKFIRNGKFDTDTFMETIKAKWLNILIAEILTTVIIFLCSLLFVIPGIIMGLAYSFVIYLVVDTDVSGSDSLKASREMMKGYKWDYFVFGLSFIGWILLVPLTLGIILVWLYPYMTVANALYYEELKKVAKK